MKIRNCKMCGIDISHLYRTANFCGDDCYNKHLQIKKHEKLQQDIKESHVEHSDPYKYIECGVCGFRGSDITSHIIKIHKMKVDEYKKTYNVTTTLSPERKDTLSERMKSDKNPGFNHGGKLSPFSKKFVGYSEVENKEQVIEDLKKKSVITKEENNNNPLTTEYYTSRGYSLKEAKGLVSERQTTFSLEKCIEKHGKAEGTKIWQTRQEKWQNTLNSKSKEELENIYLKKSPIHHMKNFWKVTYKLGGIFYILKLSDGSVKIGITKNTVRKRYQWRVKMIVDSIEIKTDIKTAYMCEQILKVNLKSYRIKREERLDKKIGWTETFKNISLEEIFDLYVELSNNTKLQQLFEEYFPNKKLITDSIN